MMLYLVWIDLNINSSEQGPNNAHASIDVDTPLPWWTGIEMCADVEEDLPLKLMAPSRNLRDSKSKLRRRRFRFAVRH